jgi:hypothetical protein
MTNGLGEARVPEPVEHGGGNGGRESSELVRARELGGCGLRGFDLCYSARLARRVRNGDYMLTGSVLRRSFPRHERGREHI